MNITISRRSKSFNPTNNVRYDTPDFGNQISANNNCAHQLNKNKSLNKTANNEELNICTKWLLSRCLKKPSCVDDEFINDQSISLQKTKEIHILKAKNKIRCTRDAEIYKIEVLSKKGKVSLNKSQAKIKLTCKDQESRRAQQRLSKCTHQSQNKIKNQQSKNEFQAFKSSDNIHRSSYQNIKHRQIDFSLKPSTVTSLNNHSSPRVETNIQSMKLKISNHFESIMTTGLKQFDSQSAIKNHEQIKSTEFISNIAGKQFSEQPIEDHLSRFQVIYPSQNQFKISDPEKSNRSINTSYIRKRIQFSSDFSDKTKLQNYIYEPVYIVNSKNIQIGSGSNTKHHKNAYSELIKTVNIEDQDYFNSAKPHSEESIVLEKGLDQIFQMSPTFRNINDESEKQIMECEVLEFYQSFSKRKRKQYEVVENVKDDFG